MNEAEIRKNVATILEAIQANFQTADSAQRTEKAVLDLATMVIMDLHRIAEAVQPVG